MEVGIWVVGIAGPYQAEPRQEGDHHSLIKRSGRLDNWGKEQQKVYFDTSII